MRVIPNRQLYGTYGRALPGRVVDMPADTAEKLRKRGLVRVPYSAGPAESKVVSPSQKKGK